MYVLVNVSLQIIRKIFIYLFFWLLIAALAVVMKLLTFCIIKNVHDISYMRIFDL